MTFEQVGKEINSFVKNSTVGSPVTYINSVGNLAIAINHRNFASKYKIKSNFRVIVKLVGIA
ncbi:SAM hydroxide adenosyltransferase [Candidatus Midichloria mitochondrii]|uniref:SAM hydroxide adenosyltransferase n=1 Tax=Candidatus Midichloria mitochondrii TaxID=234827 RepID=UPI003977D229